MNTHKKYGILMFGVALALSVLSFAPKSADAIEVPTPLSCAAETPSVVVGDYATFNASGGIGVYSWTGGEIPTTGYSNPFRTQYTTTGTKTVTVVSGRQVANCSVNVVASGGSVCTVNVGNICGQIRVSSNIDTTWEITGPENISQTIDAGTTAVVYDMATCGTYSIVNIPDRGGMSPEVTPPGDATSGSGDLTQGGVLDFDITYADSGVSDVDLKANGLNGGVEVTQGDTAFLTWETTDEIRAGSCEASSNPVSGGWTGPKDDDNPNPTTDEQSASLSTLTTYLFRLTCETTKGEDVWDEVDVTVVPPACSDEQYWIDHNDSGRGDNDGDTYYDCDDPGCWSGPGGSCDPQDPNEQHTSVCSDGDDNDHDGLIDWNGAGQTEPDPGCNGDPNGDSEDNTSTIVTECNDGLDNDGDLDDSDLTRGGIDFAPVGKPDGTKWPVDPDCESALDPSEAEDPDIREI